MATIQIEVQLYKNGKGKTKGTKMGRYAGGFDVNVINTKTMTALQLPLSGGVVIFDNLPAGDYLVVLPTRDGGSTKNLVAVFDAPYNCSEVPRSIHPLSLGENAMEKLEVGVWKIRPRASMPGEVEPHEGQCCDSAFDEVEEIQAQEGEEESSEEDTPFNVFVPCPTCTSRYYTQGTPYYLNYPAWQQCKYQPPCT